MSLLLIGDSNVERIWMHVRENREHLRSATFVPVKRIDQLATGFQALTASVGLFAHYAVRSSYFDVISFYCGDLRSSTIMSGDAMSSLMISDSIMMFIQMCFHVWGFLLFASSFR